MSDSSTLCSFRFSSLPGDVFAVIAELLDWQDIKSLLLACSSTRNSVLLSDRLWSSYLRKQFPRVPRVKTGTEGRFLKEYIDLHNQSFQVSAFFAPEGCDQAFIIVTVRVGECSSNVSPFL